MKKQIHFLIKVKNITIIIYLNDFTVIRKNNEYPTGGNMQKKSILSIASALFFIIFNSVCYGATYAPADEISYSFTSMSPGVEYTVTANFYDDTGRDNINAFYFRINSLEDELVIMLGKNPDGSYWSKASVWDNDKAYLTLTDFNRTAITDDGTGYQGYQLEYTFVIHANWVRPAGGVCFGINAIGSSSLSPDYQTTFMSLVETSLAASTGITGQPINLKAGSVLNAMVPGYEYSIMAGFYDTTGRDSLTKMYLKIAPPDSQYDIEMYYNNETDETVIAVGDSYIIEDSAVFSKQAITNEYNCEGYKVRFRFRIDKSWIPGRLNSGINFGIKAVGTADLNWAYDTSNIGFKDGLFAPADEIDVSGVNFDSVTAGDKDYYTNGNVGDEGSLFTASMKCYHTAGRGQISSVYLRIENDLEQDAKLRPADECNFEDNNSEHLLLMSNPTAGWCNAYGYDDDYIGVKQAACQIIEVEDDSIVFNDGECLQGYKVVFTFRFIKPLVWDPACCGIGFACRGYDGTIDTEYNPHTKDFNFNSGAISLTPKTKTIAIWMWDQNDDLLDTILQTDDLTKRAEFFSFLSAPYGDSSNAIDTIYLNVSRKAEELYKPPYSEADNEGLALMRSFIADAHSKGFKVEALFGETSAIETYSVGEGYLNRVYEFNKLARENEQYDGVQFDIEPHIVSGWTTHQTARRDEIWESYIENLRKYSSKVYDNNLNETKNILFGVAITAESELYGNLPDVPVDPGDTFHISDPISPPGYEQVQGIAGLDYVAIMNYYTWGPSPNGSRNEVIYADSIGKDVYIGYETKDLTYDQPSNYDAVSFWNWGNDDLESCIDSTDLRYGNTLGSNYDSYKGIAIHEYTFTDPNTGITSGYKHFPLTANKAPVAFVLDPSNDGIAIADPYIVDAYTIHYSVYDDVTVDTSLTVNGYIVRNGEKETIPFFSNSHTVTSSQPIFTASESITFNSTDHPKGGGYKIRIEVTDPEGLTGVDESDFEFHLGTGLILYYSFDIDNGSTVIDQSSYGGSHNGQVVGSASHVSGNPTDINGDVVKGSGAFNFSGGVVSLPSGDLSTRNPTAGLTKFTITLWFKSASPMSNYKLAGAAWWSYGPGSGWLVGTHYPEFWAQDHDTLRGAVDWEREPLFPEGTFRTNQWNFIAVTYDGNRIVEYINGNTDNHVIQSKASPVKHANGPIGDAHTQRLSIGGWPSWSGHNFYGQIDEVHIYDRALTLDQLDGIYQEPDFIGSGGAASSSRQGTRGFVDSDSDLLIDDDEEIGFKIGEVLYITDKNNPDTDGDSLKDGYEVIKYGTNPLLADTDNDGLTDTEEIYHEIYGRLDPNNADTDNDGLVDGVEVQNNLNPLRNDAGDDNDGDGLPNDVEILLSLNPNDTDSDDDGILDGDEDYDGDGLDNLDEILSQNDPTDTDTDDDLITDNLEVELGTCVDTYINSASPDSNYSSEIEIHINNVSGGNVLKGLIKFEVIDSIVSSGSLTSVLNATIRFKVTEPIANETVIHAYRIAETWDDSTVTWNNQPDIDDSASDPVGFGTIPQNFTGWIKIDITDIVNSWLEASSTHYGIMLIQKDAVTGSPMKEFASYNASALVDKPYLNLQFDRIEHSITQLQTQDPETDPQYEVITYVPKVHPDNPGLNFDWAFLRICPTSRTNMIGIMRGNDAWYYSNQPMYQENRTAAEQYFNTPGTDQKRFIHINDNDVTVVDSIFHGISMKKITWKFHLISATPATYPYSNADTNKWNAPDRNIFFEIDSRYTGERLGYQADDVFMSYADGYTLNQARDIGRAMYIWDQAIPIINPDNFTDPEFVNAKRDFLSFIGAPKGELNNKIKVIFLGLATRGGKISQYSSAPWNGTRVIDLDNDSDRQKVREFISDLHSRGVEVHYLAGNPDWCLTPQQSYVYNNHLAKVFSYNKAARWYEKFDAIHFDIEPHTLRAESGQPLDWRNTGDRAQIWRQYITNLQYFSGLIQNHNNNDTKKLQFGIAIGHFYNDDYDPTQGPSTPGHEQVQDIVDYVTVMNYNTTTDALEQSLDELNYADNEGKQVYIALETIKGEGLNVSFWRLGNEKMEAMFDAFHWKFNNSYHDNDGDWDDDGNIDSFLSDSYTCDVVHFYGLSNQQSYRNIIYSLENPTFNPDDAPVCIIEKPFAGGFYELDNDSIPIEITVYDPDTDYFYADVYLIDDDILVDDGSEPKIFIETNYSVDCTGTAREDTLNLNLNPTETGLNLSRSSNYLLFVDIKPATDEEKVTYDSSDDWFFINENIDGSVVVYSFEGFDSVNNIVTDDSGLGNDAQVVNIANAYPTTSGKLGNAFEFTGVLGGNGYIRTKIDSEPATNPTAGLEQFSIALWYKSPTDLRSGTNLKNYKIASAAWWHGGTNASGWVTGTHYFEGWRDNGEGMVVQGSNLREELRWENDQWHLYVLTYNRDHLIEYLANDTTGEVVDILDRWTNQENWGNAYGDPYPFIPGVGGPSEYTPLQIGACMAVASGAMTKGIIDEVRIYNRALSQGEIEMLWNNGAGRTHSEITEWYETLMSGGESEVKTKARRSLAIRGLDSDGDGISDNNEQWGDIEGIWDKLTSWDNPDSDNDGLSDLKEQHFNTDPNNPDSDNDGLTDGFEVAFDGDSTELCLFGYYEESYQRKDIDPLNPDSDYDGLNDGEEVLVYMSNALDTDTDNDGLPDKWEVENGTDVLVYDANADLDNDGLTNIEEYNNGTQANNNDSDNDGLSDGGEVNLYNTDPLDYDTDGDLISDGDEILNGLDPINAYHILKDTMVCDTNTVPVPEIGVVSNGDTSLIHFKKRYYPSVPNEEIFYAVYSSTGSLLKSVTSIPLYGEDYQVATNGDTYLVTWVEDTLVNALLISSGGWRIGDAFTVGSASGTVDSDSLAVGSYAGSYYVVWEGNDLVDNDGIYASVISSEGIISKEQFIVNSTVTGTQMNPVIASTETTLFVAWESEPVSGQETVIYGQTLDNEGNLFGNELQLSAIGETHLNPVITSNAQGYLIVFEDNDGESLNACVLDNEGIQQGNEFTLLPHDHIDIPYMISEDLRLNMYNAVPLAFGGEYYVFWEQPGQSVNSYIFSQKINSGGLLEPLSFVEYYRYYSNYDVMANNADIIVSYAGVFDSAYKVAEGIHVSYGYFSTDPELCHIDGIFNDNGNAAFGRVWRYNTSEIFYSLLALDSLDDIDGDGLDNSQELAQGTDPNNIDTDNDGLTDGDEVLLTLTDPLLLDTDSDVLSDALEINTYGTDPFNSDTDNDGLTDGEEVYVYLTDPLTSDTDEDLLTDGEEIYTYSTDPLNVDTDNDSLTDGDEVYRFLTSPVVAQLELFNENYEIYPLGSDPGDLGYSPWFVFGLEVSGSANIQGDTQNQWLNIPFSSPSGGVPPAWASFGIAQRDDSAPWETGKDFTNAVIQFDIRTNNIAEPLPDVIAIQIYEQDNVFAFRVPDADLEVVPASSEGWVTITFSINEVSYSERTWEYLERTKVTKVNIVFLQTVNNFVATGSVDIDNFRVLLPQKHRVRGFVLDINGNGVRGVDVNLKDNEGNLVYSISGNPDATNRNGRYRFLDIPFGLYVIEPVPNDNALSFTPEYQTLTIPDTTSSTYNLADFEAELAPAKHTITGYITNIMDEGVRNIEVELRDNTGALVSLPENPVTARNSGRYEFSDVLDGEYTIIPVPNDRVSHYSPDNDSVELNSFYPVTLESNFTAYFIPITHNVRGYVLDFSGNPLPDAEVELLDEAGNLVTTVIGNPAQANNAGRYVLRDVPDGIYYLKPKSGYEIFDPYREHLELTPFERVNINLDFNAVFSNSEAVSSLIYTHANGSVVNFDNKIYVIGAYNAYSGTNKIEVFDPHTETWFSKQDMPETRYNFGSFVLDDKIYCVGGQDSGSVESSVLLYDTQSDTWNALNDLPVQMFNAECAVAGGNAYILLAQQKIYNYPESIDFNIPYTYMYVSDNDSWVQKAPVPVPVEHAAVESYGGKIYVLGGIHQEVYGTNILRNDVQIYDPENDTWTTGTPIPAGIYQPSAIYSVESVLYDSKIYLFSATQTLNDNVYVYSINEDSWESFSLAEYLPLDIVRIGLINGIGLVGEYAYFVFNDTLDGQRINDVYRFNLIDIAANYGQQVSSYNYIHANGDVVSDDQNDLLYVISAYIYDSGSGKLEVYNPSTDTWAVMADMPESRYNFGSFMIGDDIYCVGGQYSNDVRNSVFQYNISSNTWSVKNNLPVQMFGTESAVVDGNAYIVCGARSIYSPPFNIPATYMYDQTNDLWIEKASMPLPVEHASVETYDGKIYVFGGLHQEVYGTHIYRTEVQVYDPQTDTWLFATPLPDDFYFNGVNSSYQMESVLYDKKVFVFPYQTAAPQGLHRFVFAYDFDTDQWTKYDLSKFLPLDTVKLGVYSGLGISNGYCYFVFNYNLAMQKIRDVYRFHLSHLVSAEFHPADCDRNWQISAEEVMDYNQAWKDGLTWGFLEEVIDINYLSRAGVLIRYE